MDVVKNCVYSQVVLSVEKERRSVIWDDISSSDSFTLVASDLAISNFTSLREIKAILAMDQLRCKSGRDDRARVRKRSEGKAEREGDGRADARLADSTDGKFPPQINQLERRYVNRDYYNLSEA